MHMKRKYRTAASLAVTIVLSAALFLLFLSIEMLTGYFRPRAFRDSLRESGYAEEMEQEMIGKQKELFSSYGLPESLADEIWEENEIYLAFYKYLDEAEDADGQWDAEDFGQRAALKKYLKAQEVYETYSVKEALEAVASQSEAIGRRYVYPSFVKSYYEFVGERRMGFLTVAGVSASVALLCIALLMWWYHSRHRALRFVAGGFFTAAIWNLSGMFVAEGCKGGFPVSGVATEYYLKFLEIFKMKGMYPWYIVNVAVILVTVFLTAAVIRLRKR